MKFIFYFIVSACLVVSCNSPSAEKNTAIEIPAPSTDSIKVQETKSLSDTSAIAKKIAEKIDTSNTVKVFKSEAPLNGFGYDIIHNGSVYVHQPHIPAIPGQRDFETEQQALAVGNLMAEKIRKNTMPPSVTVEELKKL